VQVDPLQLPQSLSLLRTDVPANLPLELSFVGSEVGGVLRFNFIAIAVVVVFDFVVPDLDGVSAHGEVHISEPIHVRLGILCWIGLQFGEVDRLDL
jgi:hypothetical protein